MPELPEVQTMVDDLRQKLIGRKIVSLWVGAPKLIKGMSASSFERLIKNWRIEEIRRRGKNVIFYFDNGSAMLIHPKLTGHFLIGLKKDFSPEPGNVGQSYFFQKKPNYYIRLIFYLDKNLAFGLSDLRKFAKVVFYHQKENLEKDLGKELGPDALEISFSEFLNLLQGRSGKIKSVLMNQKIVAGIGNIYADEILHLARVHPLAVAKHLSQEQLKTIYRLMKKILKQAIKFRGSSTSDFLDTKGRKGLYAGRLLVYNREGKPCRCGRAVIKRIKIGGRSSYFCPAEQKLVLSSAQKETKILK